MDFNAPEIALLVMLAIIVFGPEKLPELARKTARVIAYVRRIGNDARGQLRQELGPEFDNLHLADLNPRTFVSRHLLSEDEAAELRSVRDDFASVRDELAATKRGAPGEVDAPPDAAAAGDPPDIGEAEPESDFWRAVAFDPEAT